MITMHGDPVALASSMSPAVLIQSFRRAALPRILASAASSIRIRGERGFLNDPSLTQSKGLQDDIDHLVSPLPNVTCVALTPRRDAISS